EALFAKFAVPPDRTISLANTTDPLVVSNRLADPVNEVLRAVTVEALFTRSAVPPDRTISLSTATDPLEISNRHGFAAAAGEDESRMPRAFSWPPITSKSLLSIATTAISPTASSVTAGATKNRQVPPRTDAPPVVRLSVPDAVTVTVPARPPETDRLPAETPL